MSIIKHKDAIISTIDAMQVIVKKSTDEAYKAAVAVYDHREYSSKKQQELNETIEKLKALRTEKSTISSELQSVKSEVKKYSEVYAMLEKIAPSSLIRAKQLVQEEKAQRQREQEQQQYIQPTKKKKSWGLE